MLPKIDARGFAVVVDKRKNWVASNGRAWTFLFERLERFSFYERSDILLIHDEGDAGFVSRKARRARRFQMVGSMFGSPALKRPFDRLIEDAVPKNSQQSYFLQLADLVAYSAFREVIPANSGKPPIAAPFKRLARRS